MVKVSEKNQCWKIFARTSLRVFLLPPGWDASYNLRVTPSIKFTSSNLCAWAEIGIARVKCLAQEQYTMSPTRIQTQTSQSISQRTKPEAAVLCVEGSVASWLMRLSPGRVVQVRALAGDMVVVFLGKALNSHSASLHPGVWMGVFSVAFFLAQCYLGKPNKFRETSIPTSGSRNTPNCFMLQKPG